MRLPRWLGLTLLILSGMLLVWGISAWQPQATNPAQLQPLPQDPLIQVYFNHSQAASYSEPYRQQQRFGDNLEAVIVEAIAQAKTSIDIAVHEINLPLIAQALEQKHRQGVPIRVIVENTYSRGLSELNESEIQTLKERELAKYEEFVQLADQNQDGQLNALEKLKGDAIARIKQAQIPLLDDTADGSKGSGLMHHKFMVIDQKIVLVGSANWTMSDVHGDSLAPSSQGNANHLLKITNPRLADSFIQEFNLMWGEGIAGANGNRNSQFGVKKAYRSPQKIRLSPQSTITVQFSPTSQRQPWEQSVNGLIGRSLAQATKTIDFALFVFSEQQLSDRLQAQQAKGVKVRGLIESSFAYRDYSELLDVSGVALPNRKCEYEVGNGVWRSPIRTVGVPNLSAGDLLHHKMAILDQKIVITGSQNWSEAANSQNDEDLLVIDNPVVAAHFQREFDRLYQNASLGISDRLQQKIKDAQKRCAKR
jgi:phosphatidylserine/phosphatidylglycerophosphate/cardiolipin synthase-like enzyme